MRRLPAALLVLIAASALIACKDDRVVVISFRPEPGDTYRYDSTVSSKTVSQLPGSAQQTVEDRALLHSTLEVLDVTGQAARVRVVVAREGGGQRSFVMRFDRAAQLTAVESVEGIPADSLGQLGLTEIFPAGAGAAPQRPLRPGESWTIDDSVTLNAGEPPARLRGSGRLIGLGSINGRRTATVVSSTRLPVRSVSTGPDAQSTLDGTQSTQLKVIYDLDDGAVRHVSALTTARYSVSFAPPPGQSGQPVVGSLTIEVRSEIERRS